MVGQVAQALSANQIVCLYANQPFAKYMKIWGFALVHCFLHFLFHSNN